MYYKIDNCAIAILAAGASRRMGKPKQLLQFQGETFINRISKIAIECNIKPVFVVLGANSDLIKPHIADLELEIIINEKWQEGIASSIVIAIEEILEKHPETDGIMFLVADQPHLEMQHINQLIELQKMSDLPISACSYNGILGTPALFHKTFFAELRLLKGDVGAKKILEKNKASIARVFFKYGVVDIDTNQDYEKLLKSQC